MTTQSLLTKTPQNTNFLQTAKYTFVIPTLPFAKYFCQTVGFPGVSTSEIPVATPFSNTYRHGEKLVYDSLTINIMIDEDFYTWEETYNWLKAITKPTDFKEYNSRINGSIYHDGFLTLNTNANNPNLRIKFKDCHPTTLGGIQFSTMDNAEVVPTCDVTFRYDYFELERI